MRSDSAEVCAVVTAYLDRTADSRQIMTDSCVLGCPLLRDLTQGDTEAKDTN